MVVSNYNIVDTAYLHALDALSCFALADDIRDRIALNYAHAYFDYIYNPNPLCRQIFQTGKSIDPKFLINYDKYYG